jgi:fatty acid/phospholipid biosynthesis enzyme
VAHGAARPHGIAQACRYAADGVRAELPVRIAARVAALGA